MFARHGVEVVCAAFIVGQVVAGCVPVSVEWPAALTTLGAALVAPWGWRRRPVFGHLAVIVATASMGAWHVAHHESATLPSAHIAWAALPTRGLLEGTVMGPVEHRRGRMTLLLEAQHLEGDGTTRTVHGRVRLSVRNPQATPVRGDVLRVRATLRRPRGFASPGAGDWARTLRRRGIHVVASVWSAADVQLVSRARSTPATLIDGWRERVRLGIARTVPEAANGVLRALVVGDESGIDVGLREAFQRAGLVHVLSVSGLHIVLVGIGAQWLLGMTFGRSVHLIRRMPRAATTRVLALIPVVAYVLLAGGQVPAVRSGLMLACAALAGVYGRRVTPLRALALAAAAIALVSPGAPLEVAYQLSVMSVLGIIAAASERNVGPVRMALRVAAGAAVSTAPLCAWYFQSLSLVAVFVNPVVVPLFGGLVIGPGLVGALLEPWWTDASRLAFQAAGWLLTPGIAVVRWVGGWSWAAIDVPMPTSWELLLAYAALGAWRLLAGRPRSLILATLAVIALADGAWWYRDRFGRSAARVSFLDVGQGDATVIERADGRVVVIDGGGLPGGTLDTGAAVVAPFLRARKIGRIDVLVVSHAHPDHIGGVATLLERFPVGELWWGDAPGEGAAWADMVAAVATAGTRTRRLAAGDTPVDGLTVLHPPLWWLRRGVNDGSVVVRFDDAALSVLMTGDIEARAESVLTARHDLAVTVVKVPHHGSRSSSSATLVAAAAPRVAVVSVGADNRYRQPAPEVLGRWQAAGACVVRTDVCGTTTLERTEEGLVVTPTRSTCGCPRIVPISARR